MVEVIPFPDTLSIVDRTDPFLEQFNRSGGLAINGQEQIASALASRWSFTFSANIRDLADVRSFRRFASQVEGRYNYVEVAICDRARISRKMVGAVDADVTFSSGGGFSDGTTFAAAQPTSPVAVDGVEGDTTLTFDAGPLNGAMTAGVFVTIAGWLYVVEDWELSEDGLTIAATINPPLRRAVTADVDEVEFYARFIGRLDDDSRARVDLAQGKFGKVSITVLEDVARED